MIVVVPVPAEIARPDGPIVATFTSEDDHATCVVRFSVVPSLKFPVAVNGWELPRTITALVGVTVMEVIVALVTVNVAEPTCPANSAEIVALPGETPVARPLVELLTVATDGEDEVHDAEFVRSCVLPSAKTPVAWKRIPVWAATVAVAGVTCTAVRGAASTTRCALPDTEPSCAVIVAVPADWPVTKPKFVTVATAGAEDVQVAAVLMF